MANMNDLKAIQERVQEVVESSTPATFIYDLLRAYGLPKASVTRLEKGDYNQAKANDEILWKKRLFFTAADPGQLRTVVEEAARQEAVKKHEPRFVVATDFETIVARDMKTDDSLDIPFTDLSRRYEFFLPWAGIEKSRVLHENPADVRAAEKMAGLYDEILRENPDLEGGSHDLNVFFARILFCLFAEDTGIFAKDIFSNAVESYTDERAENFAAFLDEVFVTLDTRERTDATPFYVRDFPYVNGGLFNERIAIPKFSPKARRILIESGSELDWSEINPDIFGSMMQAVAHEEQRAGLGMHYTSVPNIMKVIGPLLLDELREEYGMVRGSETKLRRLWERLSRIRFFDPACGSGNFLIVTYKEIRKLEIEVIAALETLAGGQAELYLSRISLDQFFGLEIDDFAHEVATLSLWLAEHQMNVAFRERFGRVQPYLPLSDSGRIVCGNAALLDWEDVCPRAEGNEVYLMGNPPYLGSSLQSGTHKEEMRRVFAGFDAYKNLDYISIWFYKAAEYVRNSPARAAFVTTSSICQGEQVSMLWPRLLERGVEIFFAHLPFKWTNNARGNAGVWVAIIGLRSRSEDPLYLFSQGHRTVATQINPYLVDGPTTFVEKRRTPASRLPRMTYGSKPVDFGNLTLSTDERARLLQDCPTADRYVRLFLGAQELIEGVQRWCLWIPDKDLEEAARCPAVAKRLQKVADRRRESTKAATRRAAETPHRFGEPRHREGRALVVPLTTSERRDYIPIAFVASGTVVSNAANVVYDPDVWVFAVLSARMHMAWVRAVSGRLKADYRYSATISYNTFPFPGIEDQQRQSLEQGARAVIVAREQHSEKNLADLYDPDDMPDNLRNAHAALDRAVDRCYRDRPFSSDEERLQVLFEMYEKMTRDENE